ncbi:MAG: serine protease [Bdellovibrio sp.]|nr:serine protease [Bdellovibrio sp.]
MKIIKTVILVGFLSVTSISNAANIIGGDEATPGEFPYIVALYGLYGHYCGGSLIAPNWVLTAAHCVKAPNNLRSLKIGLHEQSDTRNVETFKPKRIVAYPRYNGSTTNGDFALVELSGNSQYPVIPLNTMELQVSPQNPLTATIAGWGSEREGASQGAVALQKVDVPLVTFEKCNKAYKGKITELMLCAGYPEGGKDSCQGDSGGPLVLKRDGQDVLIGIVSWGDGCGRRGVPGVYSKVSAAIDWIKTVTQ